MGDKHGEKRRGRPKQLKRRAAEKAFGKAARSREGRPDYEPEQLAVIDRVEGDLAEQLAGRMHRLAHSLSVARTAESMALVYGVDPFLARVAGTLHDWEKARTVEEQVELAGDLGVDLGVDVALVKSLLHGIIAARTLPRRYPELPKEIWRAIEVHTTGAADMSPLDMVVFVADGIEPLRPDVPAIERQRKMVGKVPLEDLFWTSFTDGIAYVIETGRYLYPGTIDVYNSVAARRRENRR